MFQTNEDSSSNKNHPYCLMSFLWIMQIALLRQDKVIFHYWKSLRELFVFLRSELCFETKTRNFIIILLIIFIIQNIKSIIFFKSFLIIFSWWMICSFPIIFICKKLNFDILCEFFQIILWINGAVAAYWKHLPSYLFIVFIVAFFYPIWRIYIWSTEI